MLLLIALERSRGKVMPCFEEYFRKTNGHAIEYKGLNLSLYDEFPVSDGDRLILSIESTKSKHKQGFSIYIKGTCVCNGEYHEHINGVKMLFWEDTTPKRVELTVNTTEKSITIQNFWEITNYQGNSFRDCSHNGAAMIVEEIENGRRYRCNDITPDDDFDDIIFTVCYAKPKKNMSKTPR